MDWDEQARASAIEAAAKREPGWYWIKRNEPDVMPAWEVGNFVSMRFGPGHDRPGWYVCGTQRRLYEVAKPFSNRWEIGDRILPPA